MLNIKSSTRMTQEEKVVQDKKDFEAYEKYYDKIQNNKMESSVVKT